jgi:hypothetical protein
VLREWPPEREETLTPAAAHARYGAPTPPEVFARMGSAPLEAVAGDAA